jgi:hypothetical protein
MIVTASISAAVLCIAQACHPALFGRDTPRGTFPLQQRIVLSAGYGGDVMQFAETRTEWFGVHRVWLGRPAERRAERLSSPDAARRRDITGGCINVAPHVYEALKASGATSITITE